MLLDPIIQHKRRELASSQSKGDMFVQTFTGKQAKLIAEIKLASPSFDVSDRIDRENMLAHYRQNKDIHAVSILIDQKYFKGDVNRIRHIKPSNKPCLFKEFIIDTRQIDGASYYGYDALLLIRRILTPKQLDTFLTYSMSKSVYPIVEVDNESDLLGLFTHPQAKQFGIALNARNLDTGNIDTGFHHAMYDKYIDLFAQHTMFAFSGITDLTQQQDYKGKYDGLLVGSYFSKKFAAQHFTR